MKRYRRRKDLLVFGSPLIEAPEIREVVATLKSGWLGKGPRVQRFEEMFRRYKGCRYAVALNSCTSAIFLSLRAIGIKAGDEVILPSMTYAATANAVIAAGARPVFADCGRRTMTIDPADIRRKLTRRTRAIIPVHFAGRPAAMDEIMGIAHRRHVHIIEDCAHAIETEYHGKKAGLIGDLGAFSFYVNKNITTGDGGMVITNNGSIARKIKIMASQGMEAGAWDRFGDTGYTHYRVTEAGYKCAMVDMQAALGVRQLPKVARYWKMRRKIWGRYDTAFAGLPLLTPLPAEPRTKHAYDLYTVLLDLERLSITRDRFLAELLKRNIGAGVHYIALHLHPYYRKRYGYRRGDLPASEWISARTVSLPLSAKLRAADVNDVIGVVTEIACLYAKPGRMPWKKS